MSMPPLRLQDRDAPSSSSSISSPPDSPPPMDTIHVAPRLPNLFTTDLSGGVFSSHLGSASASSAHVNTAQHNNATHNHNHNPNANVDTAAPPKQPGYKRQRKPTIKSESAAKDEKPKEKKPRKPREPKKNEDGTTAAPPRKRQKAAEKPAATATANAPAPATAPAPAPAPAPSQQDARHPPTQQKITEMVGQFQTPGLPASAPLQQQQQQQQQQHYQQPPPSSSMQPFLLSSQPQQSTTIAQHRPDSLQPPQPKAPTPRPVSSGQNFDPIRGGFIDSTPPPPPPPTNGVSSAHASPKINRASASPSIISLIDPPQPAKSAMPSFPYSSHSSVQQPAQSIQPAGFVSASHHSPTTRKAVTYPSLPSQPTPLQQSQTSEPALGMDGAMDLDDQDASKEAAQKPKSSSSAPTPQPQQKPKERKAASPKASGTGLLASTDLFGGSSASSSTKGKGVNIDIQITLNKEGGNVINMAQEIAKKYGRDAVNPRAAAHRERLLQVAAAANRLEGGSADDMSVDLMSELDGDSNVEMGGMDDEGNTATGADDDKPKRKRAKKVEEYDKEDDFIDDTELAWQEHAAVAKDGFFVYSGPLIPAGQVAQVESNAPAGRGRGGGRGRGRGRGAAATNGTSARADTKEVAKDPNAPPPVRGRGSRGGRGAGAPRKPRITKADKDKLEAEKALREQMAGGQPPPLQLGPTASTNNTTMPPLAAQTPPMQVYSNGTGATSTHHAGAGVPA